MGIFIICSRLSNFVPSGTGQLRPSDEDNAILRLVQHCNPLQCIGSSLAPNTVQCLVNGGPTFTGQLNSFAWSLFKLWCNPEIPNRPTCSTTMRNPFTSILAGKTFYDSPLIVNGCSPLIADQSGFNLNFKELLGTNWRSLMINVPYFSVQSHFGWSNICWWIVTS